MDKHMERLERFKNLRHTKNQEKWEECITISENNLYKGQEIDDSLEVMEIIDEYYDKIAAKLAEQGHSGASYSVLLSIINDFYKFNHCMEDF